MEITKTVRNVRTTLLHLEHDLECELKSISGYDEEAIRQIGRILEDPRLQSFFQIEDDEELRQLHFLLFLNIDLKISSELETDSNVGHVVGAIPSLSSRLYLAFVKRYNLFEYMEETLKFCPIIVVVEFLEVIDTDVKHLPAVDRFEILGTVLEAISHRLARTDCEFSLNNLAEHFQALMLHFKKLVVDTGESTKKNRIQIVEEGYKFACLVSLFLSSTKKVFGESVLCEPSPSVYEMTIRSDPVSPSEECKLKSKSDIIRMCYEIIYYKCQELMEEIDLDTFLTWYEIPMKENNLQTFIGEIVFHLCHSLEEKKSQNLLPADAEILISMLESVVIKPRTTDEETCGPNNIALEESILRSDVFDKDFFQRVEHFLQDSCFRPEVNFALLEKLFDDKTHSNADLECVKRVIVLALQKLEIYDVMARLDEFIIKYGLNHFMVKDNNDFAFLMKRLSVVFTKDDVDSEEQEEEEYTLQREREVLKEVALMGFHATCHDIKSIIGEACTDKHDVVVVEKILETLRVICSYKVESNTSSQSHTVLIRVLKEFLQNDYPNLTLAEKSKFSRVVISLSNHELLHVDDFLSTCLLPLLYVNENSNWSVLSELLQLFTDVFANGYRDLGLCWPILLIQVAQLLEDSRWSMTTFSEERMVMCQRAIDAINVLMEHPQEVTECIRRWMENQLKTYSSLTRSYFTSVSQFDWTPSIDDQLARLITAPFQSHQEFIKEFSENEDVYVVKMGELLLCCTQKEIERIVENYSRGPCHNMTFLFDWMSDSVTFISNTVRHFGELNVELVDVVYNCLEVLVRNFLRALLKNIADDREFDYIKYVNRIIIVVKKLPENRSNVCKFNILKFLAEEVPHLNKLSPNFEDNIKKVLTGVYML